MIDLFIPLLPQIKQNDILKHHMDIFLMLPQEKNIYHLPNKETSCAHIKRYPFYDKNRWDLIQSRHKNQCDSYMTGIDVF
jgi:hypothetical protein